MNTKFIESEHTLNEIRYAPARVDELRQARIGLSHPLNRLSQTNPEAFFYWHKVETLLNHVIWQKVSV